MPIPRAEQDRGRRKRRSCPHQPGADYCQQLALTRSSALTQHALPGPELSWSRSPRGQGGQKKQEVWDGLSPGAGSPKRQALRSALPPTPHRPLPALSLWHFPGVRFGGWSESKNPDVLWGHSRHSPRVLFAVPSLGLKIEGVQEGERMPWS